MLLLALDLIGIFAFAVSGALDGVRKQLDVFGVIVVAVAAALGGGMIRDLLIGAVPPASLQDWRYLLVPLPAALVAFRRSDRVVRAAGSLLFVDAAGLGLFAVAGTRKALNFGLSAVASVGIGIITAVGGGLLRDVLLREIPRTLRPSEPYGFAAMLGAIIVVTADHFDLPQSGFAVAGVLLTFVFRMVSVRQQWATTPAAQRAEPSQKAPNETTV